MGQKVNPISLRLGINKTWDSRWYGDANFADQLHKDIQVRNFLKKELAQASISKVVIERPSKSAIITIHTARPAVVLGKKGANLELLRKNITRLIQADNVRLNILEVRKPELDSQLVGDGVAKQIEKRVSFKRAMKRAVQSAMRMGALGIRINVSGRLGGAEIARTEWYREGRVPLHTLRADIDYATSEALTTYGIIGIKVWIFKGELMEHNPMASENAVFNARKKNNRRRKGV